MKLDILPKARPTLKVVYRNSEMAEKSVQRFTSVDPLASNFAAWSPFSYTFNNPIRFIDPDGRAPEDWIDKDGNQLNDDQLQNVKVYIFYDPSEDGFSEQTMKQYDFYTKKYGEGSVALSNVATEAEFQQDWGDISGSPELIMVNHHGTNQALHLDASSGEYIVSTENGKTNKSGTEGTNVSALPTTKGDVSNTMLCLNTCNSNNSSQIPIKSGTTLAKGFSQNTGVGMVRGTNKSVNFGSDGMPKTQWYYGGFWQYFQNGNRVESPNKPNLPSYGELKRAGL